MYPSRWRSPHRTTRLVVISLVAMIALIATACGDGVPEDRMFGLASDVVSHPTTRDMLVFAPEAEGSWPVVFAFHGVDGNAADMAEFGRQLASRGYVVFAPTYRTDMTTTTGLTNLIRDAECSYRFARSIASEYGGDLDQPVTVVGWSLGATLALAELSEDIVYPSGKPVGCFEEAPRPEVIVAISGCHYEHEGQETGLDTSGWGHRDTDVVLMAGEDDTTCAAWQSQDAAEELHAKGYDVDLVMLKEADHYAPIFHGVDTRAGEQAIDVIVRAIGARAR